MSDFKFFQKANLNNYIYAAGEPIKFDPIDGYHGVLKTNNPKLIADLEGFIQRQSGGVTALTEAQYEALVKKNVSLETYPSGSREEISGITPDTVGAKAVAAAPASPAANGGKPSQPETPMPTTPATPEPPVGKRK